MLQNSCQPSPCGPYSQCSINSSDNSAECSCLNEFIAEPPRCRPECLINADCFSDKACINHKCSDTCSGLCGDQAECRVLSHTAMCYCSNDLVGDPFEKCVRPEESPTELIGPRRPNPCGPNALCRIHNDLSICQSL